MKSRRFCVASAAGMACAGVCFALCALAWALPAQQQTAPQKADSILILKKDHVMELLAGGKVIRTYKVALGRGGLAPKEREGDGRTPEGRYIIDSRNTRPAIITRLCTSPIPTQRTARGRRSWESRQAEQS